MLRCRDAGDALNCMRVWNRRGLSSAAAGPLSRKGPGLAQRSPSRARPLPGSALAACGPGARAGAGATCAPRIPEAIACAALRRRCLCLRLRGLGSSATLRKYSLCHAAPVQPCTSAAYACACAGTSSASSLHHRSPAPSWPVSDCSELL